MMTQTLADAPFGDGTAVEAVAPGGLKFAAGDEFYHELRRRVERYFRSTGRPRRDRPKMYLKTALLVLINYRMPRLPHSASGRRGLQCTASAPDLTLGSGREHVDKNVVFHEN